MSSLAHSILRSFWSALDGAEPASETVTFTEPGELPSIFATTDFASAAVAAAALALRALMGGAESSRPIVVDRRLSSFWFAASLRPIGWALPPDRDPMTGDYATQDGWIRLHANAPRHRAAAARVLGGSVDLELEAIAGAVSRWRKSDLEHAIIAAGGCAAEMRSIEEWNTHPQGLAVACEPLVHFSRTAESTRPERRMEPSDRPLAGVRVLDLTRVLAGPVATRFLAGCGADVLRIDPPGWEEPGVVPEVTLGKRCARLDLRSRSDRACFESLLAQADVLIHGYRPSALAELGYAEETRQRTAPGLIDVSLDAYGWTGPWRERRGFDSLVQMSSGIADAGMRCRRATRPVPLPVQALDHATGYLLAAAALRGLAERRATRQGCRFRLSLARTARALIDWGTHDARVALAPEQESDVAPSVEVTPWGRARRLRPPVSVAGAALSWELPASALGSAAPRFAT